MIDKRRLLDALRVRVARDLATLERRQRDSQEGSTHEENRPEHAKDMRSTEESYLARGLAGRVEDLRRAALAIASLPIRDFGADDAIAVGAVAVLAHEGDAETTDTWWIVASAGGFELELDGTVVRTLTPVSPLGSALLGLHAGDEGSLRSPRGERRFEVLEVL